MIRILVAAVLALAMPLTAVGAGVVESLKGTAHRGDSPLYVGQKILAPTTISTGAGAQVFLRFEDGTQIVLGENSLLRMVDFRFTPGGGPEAIQPEIPLLAPGDSRTIEFTTTAPGQYGFECSFHTQLGQVGTMTVSG